jgi:hypothetical protein
MNSHSLVLALKSAGRDAEHPKTVVVVAVGGIVVVAIRRPTIPRIVVPRTAALGRLPRSILTDV